MTTKIINLLFLIFTFYIGNTQEAVIDSVYTYEKIKKSTSFASLTLGGDLLTLGHSATLINGLKTQLPAQTMPRINVGGTHFWGHTDFYVTFPLGLSLGLGKAGVNGFNYTEGVETGAKFYPWAMKKGRLTPYIGISFQPMSFKYTLKGDEYKYEGSNYSKFITPIHAGLTYTSRNYMYNIGARWVKNANFDYYQSPDIKVASSYSPLNFNISIFRFMDTDKSLASSRALDQLNKKYYVLEKENGISGWYWAIGPSTALQMSKSSYFKNAHPYFYEDMNNSFLVPEIAVGKYYYKGDFNVNVAARYMFWSKSAFDTKITMSRFSTAVEGYKFLLDYHGFVPFVGPSIMLDHLVVNENGSKITNVKPAIGIVFGWDIRLSQTGTSLLRTNLRYVPGHHVKVRDDKIMFDHLEFNFIQYVKFFGRAKIYKKYRKEN